MTSNKKIFIFGGSGSLGNALIKHYLHNNDIVVFSRDECKHWKMSLQYKTDKIKYIIGDIRNYDKSENALIRENPHIVIVASALKHIDRCEYAVDECVQTNYNGILNVTNAVEKNKLLLSNLRCVVYVSTDKACSPINTYGISKALGERVIVEKSLHVPNVKFVCVRYGNVLNSNGSIIPILHAKGRDLTCHEFTLTHNDMTRFIQTLQDSVDLIDHAMKYAESGDIVIPRITSMKVKHLIELFSEKYGKPIVVTGLRPGEKMLESLMNESQSASMVYSDDGSYHYIKPPYKKVFNIQNSRDYNSHMNTISKEELKEYLESLSLI